MTKMILNPTDSISQFIETGGGKAKNLAKLSQMNAPVPPWFCVSTEAFRLFVKENGLERLTHLDSSFPKEKAAALAAEIEAAFLKAPLPESIQTAIREGMARLGGNDIQLAVRSSGLDEDSADH